MERHPLAYVCSHSSLHSINGRYYVHYTSKSPLFFSGTIIMISITIRLTVDIMISSLHSLSNLHPSTLSLPVVDCGDLPSPGPDGLVDFTDTTFGASATYTCTTTCYGLVPNTPTRTCMANSEWSGDDPTCQCKY